MKQTNDFLIPDYFPDFHCKMGDCRAACCQGWPISISMENYFSLLGMDCPPDLRSRLDVGLRMVEHPTKDEYARFNPRWDGNCPMRMEDGRCSLHAEIGEDSLPEVCRLYPVDGIHLDYIRYNHLCNGWSETDFANLQAMGADVSHIKEMIERTLGYNGRDEEPEYIFEQFRQGDADAHLIAKYRRGNVIAYAKKIAAAAREVKPDVILSAALMPEGAYDLAFADLHYGQNYADLSAVVDFIMPMTYSLDYHQDAAWVTKVAEGALEKGGKVLMGLQAYGTSTTEQLTADVAAVRGLLENEDAEVAGENLLGIALFRTGEFSYVKLSQLGAEDLDQAIAKAKESMPDAGCVYIVCDK